MRQAGGHARSPLSRRSVLFGCAERCPPGIRTLHGPCSFDVSRWGVRVDLHILLNVRTHSFSSPTGSCHAASVTEGVRAVDMISVYELVNSLSRNIQTYQNQMILNVIHLLFH